MGPSLQEQQCNSNDAIQQDPSPKKAPATHRPFLRCITYNIWDGGCNNLNVALQSMQQMRINLGVFTETKLDHDMYTRHCCGYEILSTKAASRHQGGVALFWRSKSFGWDIEGVHCFGPNVIWCLLVSGNCRWTLVGAYIPPSEDDGSTLSSISQAIQMTHHAPIIFFGDINVDLQRVVSDRDCHIATELHLLGLVDVADGFCHPRGRWTWSQQRGHRYIRSTTDCVLTTQRRFFKKWAIKWPRYYSDHRAILTELWLAPAKLHRSYVRSRTCLPKPIRPLQQIDQWFDNLAQEVKKPAPKDIRERSWIAKDTWHLIDKRAQMYRRHSFGYREARWNEASDRQLGSQIRTYLRRDRRRRADDVGDEME